MTSEPLFGLTKPAAALVQEMADDFRQRLPDVGRRTRRVYPASGSRLVLCKYVGTTNALGPRNSNGIAYEGNVDVYDHLVTGTTAPSPIGTGTGSGKYCKGIILPNQLFWARYANDKYWAIDGAQCLKGTVAEDFAGGVGDVTFYYDSGATVDISCEDLCGDIITSGTTVVVNATFLSPVGSEITLYVVRTCCPAFEV